MFAPPAPTDTRFLKIRPITDDALEKAVAAHKAGIDPARAWFGDDMFEEPDFTRLDFDGEERVCRIIA